MTAGLGSATINVLANTTNFENSLRRSFKRIGAATAGIVVGVGISNFLSGAIKNSIQLERELAKIQTIIDKPADRGLFSAKTLREFSNELGASTTKLNEALYLAISSGTDAADAMELVRQSWKLATATGADLTQVVDAATSALNAFGDNGMTATAATDIMFKALQYGKGTMTDFAHYISTAIPIADALGVSFESVAATGATLTRTGMSSRKAFTGMKVAMQELSDATKGGGKAFKKTMGEDFQTYVKRTHDLSGAFTEFAKKVDPKFLTNIFGAKEGAAALQTLASIGPKVFKQISKDTTDSAGVTDKAYKRIDETVSRQIERLKVEWQNFKGAAGDALGPATARGVDFLLGSLRRLKTGVSDVVSWIKDKWQIAQDAWDRFVGAMATIGDINRFQGILKSTGDTIARFGQTVQDAFTIAAAAIQPFITPLGAVAAFLVAMFGPALVGAINLVLMGVQGLFGFLANHQTLVGSIAIAVGVLTVALNLNAISLWATTTAALAWNAAVAITAAVTGGLTTAFWALDAALAANPVGAVITGVVALGAAFIYAWKKSETFRTVVITIFNHVKDAIVTAVSIWFRAITMWVRGVLNALQAMADAWSKLPKILGGGVAANISGAIQEVLDGLNAVQRGIDSLHDKDIHIRVITHYMDADSVGPVSALKNEFTAEKSGAMGAARAAAAAAGASAIRSAANSTKTYGGYTPSRASGGGSYSDDKAAKKAADEAARAIKAAMKRLGPDLVRIGRQTSKQTTDTIKNNFDKLIQDLKDAGKTSYIAGAVKKEKELLAQALKRDKLNESLKAAKDNLKELKNAAAEFGKTIKDSFLTLGNVTTAPKGIGTTFTGIRNQLRAAVIHGKQFTEMLNKLRSLKLNDTALKDLIEAGPEAGRAAAMALVQSGQRGVAEINNLQAQLNKAGDAASKQGMDWFHSAGIKAAQGVVDGLEKEQSKIIKAMDHIADAFAVSVVKKLGLKVDTKQFESAATKKVSKVTPKKAAPKPKSKKTTTSTSSSITVHVNGVSDPAAAKKSGVTAGKAIQSVLDKQRATVIAPVV